ncbi:MAG: PDZ domain-containing protein [Myxococcales bacterium]|nr:PDZ domain-containing protein [Myxococcales bacterium]
MSWKRLIPVAVVLFSLAPAGPADATLRCQTVPKLMDSYLQAHVTHKGLTAELRERAIDSYLEAVDSSKTLFLAEEAEAIRADRERIFRELRAGKCDYLTGIQKRLHQRYQSLEMLVRGIVGRDDFELDPTIELTIDPDDRGYPKDEIARSELVRKLAHFQISNLLAGEEGLDEARERLIHRYELMTKRSSEVTDEDVLSLFVDAFARSLDPHSNYFSADAMEDFQIGMSLSLEGIGVALSSRDGYPVVEQIIPGGATDRTDALEPNDKIIAVAQAGESPVSVVDMALRDVVRLIRGKKGSTVKLTVLRQKEKTERFNVSIVRDTIDLKEQAAKLSWATREVDGRTLKLAVLDLRSFYGDRSPNKRRSSDDVKALLREARKGGADGLLLDLSRNGGGNLEYAVQISGFFIEEGGIVAIRESSGREKVLNDPSDDLPWAGPLVVLTSRISASASEILVGALKDYDRAVLVGDSQTFGKGSVQTVIPLPPGLGALKVTTAMFFRPGGASTQMAGVEPHIRIPSAWDRKDFGESEQPYALPSQRITPFVPVNGTRKARKLGDWRRLTPDVLAELSARSQARVSGNEGFGEVVAKLAEAEEAQGAIRLAEILEKREASKPDPAAETGPPEPAAGDAAVTPPADPNADDGEDDDVPTLQVEEGLDILADLITLGS